MSHSEGRRVAIRDSVGNFISWGLEEPSFRDVPVVTAENAREMFGAGSVLGEGLTVALSPGGILHDLPKAAVYVLVSEEPKR